MMRYVWPPLAPSETGPHWLGSLWAQMNWILRHGGAHKSGDHLGL
jgi:hypothetical protein